MAGDRSLAPASGSPVQPRLSSSVILARPAARAGGEIELFMVRRNPRSEFAASAYVFPGGSVRPDDRADEALAVCQSVESLGDPQDPTGIQHAALEDMHQLFSSRGSIVPPSPRDSVGLIVAALRELFEEAGVLLACEPDGAPVRVDSGRVERLAAARAEVEEGRTTLAAVARGEGVQLSWRSLVYFSHWITPRISPVRFDTRFFLAQAPQDQEPLYGPREMTDGVWVSPSQALEQSSRGDFSLVWATQRHLERLQGRRTVEELLEFGRTKPITTVEPLARQGPAGLDPYFPPDQLEW